MGGGGIVITRVSPLTPAYDISGSNRTFSIKVNIENPIIRWILDDVIVNEQIPSPGVNTPVNSEYSYTSEATFGNHIMKVEVEKNGVMAFIVWEWNVDECVSTCSNTFFSLSGEIYIKIKKATLYRRPNSTFYITIDWFVHGCQATNQRVSNGEIALPLCGPCCELIVKTGICWNYIGMPGGPSPYPDEQTQEIVVCSSNGSNTFESPLGQCTAYVKLQVKCFAYLISEAIPPLIPAFIIPIRTKVSEEIGVCYCYL